MRFNLLNIKNLAVAAVLTCCCYNIHAKETTNRISLKTNNTSIVSSQSDSKTSSCNYYRSQVLLAGNTPTYRAASLMCFDLGILPKNAKIKKAVLKLKGAWWGANTWRTVSFRKCLSAWDPQKVTWNNFGSGNGGTAGVDYAKNSSFTQSWGSWQSNKPYREIDITEQVKQWQSKPSENFGYYIKAITNPQNLKSANAGKDWGDECKIKGNIIYSSKHREFPPHLLIEYEGDKIDVTDSKAENNVYAPTIDPRLLEDKTKKKNTSKKIVRKSDPNNPVLGKKVYYSRAPASPKDPVDISRLTDGIICPPHVKDRNKIVGWYTYDVGNEMGVYVCVDLEKVKKLKDISIRLFTDTRDNFRRRLPAKIEAAVSRDGKDFYKVGKSFCKTYFYGKNLPSDSKAFAWQDKGITKAYSFKFNLDGAEARYVGFHIIPEGFTFYTDEISSKVFKGNSSKGNQQIYKKQNIMPFFIGYGLSPKNLVFWGPPKDYLAVPENINLPNQLLYADYRGKGEESLRRLSPAKTIIPPGCNEFEFVMELPAGISLIETARIKANTLIKEKTADGGTRFIFRLDPGKNRQGYVGGSQRLERLLNRGKFGPLYLRADRKIRNTQGTFYCRTKDGKALFKKTVPVFSVNIPKVPKYTNRVINGGWIFEGYGWNWPEYPKVLKHMGFNSMCYIPGHTRMYGNRKRYLERSRKYIANMRASGIAPVTIISPIHGVKINSESCCPAKGLKHRLCFSYTGKYYQDELKRIAQKYAEEKTNMIFFDCEPFWGDNAGQVKRCPVCSKMMKRLGLDARKYLLKCGERMLKDVCKAVRKVNPKVKIGFYYLHANQPGGLQGVFPFDKVYPEAVNFAMPEYYGAGMLDHMHNLARAEAVNLKNPHDFITWISPGTFGTYPAFKLKTLIYEQLMNGGGITFFAFPDFVTPMQYKYVADALRNLAPYQELLNKGKLYPKWKCGRGLYCTAWGNKNECLLLVGNYCSPGTVKCKLLAPLNGKYELIDIEKKKKLKNRNILIKPQQSRLFYAKRIK